MLKVLLLRSLLSLFLLLLVLFIGTCSSQQQCSTSLLVNGNQRSYATCASVSSWANLAWTFDSSNSTLDMIFRAALSSSSGWAGWGINFGSSPAMVGAKVLLGFRDSAGTVRLAQYDLVQANKAGTLPLPSSTAVLNIVPGSILVDITNNVVSIFAKIRVPAASSFSPSSNSSSAGAVPSTTLNCVWSRGPGITSSFSPLPHDTSPTFLKQSTGTIELSKNTISRNSAASNQKLKNQHGILNTFGWGILLPVGAMVARYLKPFHDPAWFYTHASLQGLGYLFGTVGWGLGLKLRSLSGAGDIYKVHRNIGTVIFIFASLQVLAFLLRPPKRHRIRFYWNIYHRSLGYLTLILIFTNIYKGFKILQPPETWKSLYTGFLVLAVLTTISLEAYTWHLVFKKKKKNADSSYSNAA